MQIIPGLPEMMIKICDLVGYYEELVDAQAEIKIAEQESTCHHCFKEYCDCSNDLIDAVMGDN